MKLITILFICFLGVHETNDYKIPLIWETLNRNVFSWADYNFKKDNKTIIVLFRTTDCMGCIKNIMGKLEKKQTGFVGIVGYLKEEELYGAKMVLSQYCNKILLDKKFTFIRHVKAHKSPYIIGFNKDYKWYQLDKKIIAEIENIEEKESKE